MRGKKAGPTRVAIQVMWADLESVPLKQAPQTYAKLLETLSTLYGVSKANLKLTYLDPDGDRSLIYDESSFESAKEYATVSKSLTITATEEEKSGKLDLTESTQILPATTALGRLASFYIEHQTQMSPSIKRLYRKVLKSQADELVSVDLSENHLDAENARFLSRLLPHALNLTCLSLQSNPVQCEGIKYVLAGLQTMAERKASDDELVNHRPDLRELLVQKTRLGEEGGIALGLALRYFTGLQSLKLDDNLIGDGGVAQVAKSLPLLAGLENLGLDSNDISDEGLKRLCAALTRLRHLRVLWLEKNRITNTGAEVLSAVTPHSLQFLWLGGNPGLDQLGLILLRSTLGRLCQVFS